jgi:hypothetical protein
MKLAIAHYAPNYSKVGAVVGTYSWTSLWDLNDPKAVYYWVLQNGGKEAPNFNALRMIAMTHPKWAYKWARDIDQAPSPEARNAVVASTWQWWAYCYARDVEGFHPDTLKAVEGNFPLTQLYRKNVIQSPKT